jgi:2-polyprenyl-6-methoxyphenol hydroxylase-like FAD-dependent oxidoreductase
VESTPEEEILQTQVLARRWPGPPGRGRVSLIGDAWHPLPTPLRLSPTLAIEDAVALAEALARGGDPVEALRTFEQARRSRIIWATEAVWRLRTFETRPSPAGSWARDLTARHFPRALLGRLLGRLLMGTGPRDSGAGQRHAGAEPVTGAPPIRPVPL